MAAGRLSQADFTLITDAVREGVEQIVECESVQRLLEKDELGGVVSHAKSGLSQWALRKLAESFASKLQYTNDGFDKQKFISGVTQKLR